MRVFTEGDGFLTRDGNEYELIIPSGYPPGNYEVTIKVIDPNTGEVVRETTQRFTIEPLVEEKRFEIEYIYTNDGWVDYSVLETNWGELVIAGKWENEPGDELEIFWVDKTYGLTDLELSVFGTSWRFMSGPMEGYGASGSFQFRVIQRKANGDVGLIARIITIYPRPPEE